MKEVGGITVPQVDGIIKGVFHIESGDRGILDGLVLDQNEQPVKSAAALLYRLCGNGELELVTYAFSDESGRFLLGPLSGDREYFVRVGMCVSCSFSEPESGKKGAERDSPERYMEFKKIYSE